MTDYTDLKFVSFDTALQLESAGFYQESLFVYQYSNSDNKNPIFISYGSPKKNLKLKEYSTVGAPTLAEASRWIKKEYGISIAAIPIVYENSTSWKYNLRKSKKCSPIILELLEKYSVSDKEYSTEEESIDVGIRDIIKHFIK